MQPSGRTTQVEELEVEGRSRKFWGGVPTWTAKEDQGPSLPSLCRWISYMLSYRSTDFLVLFREAHQYSLGGTSTTPLIAAHPPSQAKPSTTSTSLARRKTIALFFPVLTARSLT